MPTLNAIFLWINGGLAGGGSIGLLFRAFFLT